MILLGSKKVALGVIFTTSGAHLMISNAPAPQKSGLAHPRSRRNVPHSANWNKFVCQMYWTCEEHLRYSRISISII